MALSASEFAAQVNLLPEDIDKMLVFCSKNNCSDLFIKVGEPAFIERYGIMYQTSRKIDDVAWEMFAQKAITSELNAKYVREKFVDFSYEIGNYRYRANVGFSTGQHIATFRMISEKLPSFDSLKIDSHVVDLLKEAFSADSGISLIVGVTGSGKTSTLAACINSFSAGYRNQDNNLPLKDAHLITLEDPIEYLYPSTPATRIVQKELEKDFSSFDNGIKSALREHPTHILVGETRDKETIRALVEAARTGHLVLSTFHTATVADTIARLYSYLAGENEDVMYDLVANLNFVLAQHLIKGRTGYTLNYQYMFFTDEIKKVLTKAIASGSNVSVVIDRLIHNEQLQQTGLCSDWLIP